MSLVAHDAGEIEGRRLADGTRQFDRRAGIAHTTAMHADVHLDEHAQADASRVGGRGECGDIGGIVDRNHHFGTPGEVDETGDLLCADDLVGDENIVEAVPHQHFGFAELGAGEPVRAGCQQPLRDGRRLRRLEVRAQRRTAPAEERAHGGDVLLHHVEVDDERRSIELGDIHAPGLAQVRAT